MPPNDFGQRCHMIYFPTKEKLDSWKALAHEAKLPLSKWIIAIVEESLESPSDEQPASQDIQSLRKENIRLRKEKEILQKSLSERETELFKLRYGPAMNSRVGRLELDSRLIALLQDGCVWTRQDILEALEVDSRDVEALQTITALMQRLDEVGVVVEGARGWKWKKS